MYWWVLKHICCLILLDLYIWKVWYCFVKVIWFLRFILVLGIWRWKWSCKILWFASRWWSRLRRSCRDRSFHGKQSETYGTSIFPSLTSTLNILMSFLNLQCYLLLITISFFLSLSLSRFLISAGWQGLLQFCSVEGGHHLYLKTWSSNWGHVNDPSKTRIGGVLESHPFISWWL